MDRTTSSHQQQQHAHAEQTAHDGHDHDGNPHAGHDHDDPAALNHLSVTATIHCMTGCVIGEVLGMVIATALGWGNVASIALAVGLAFVFGYALTSMPLLKAGLALGAVIPIALAVDTLSITTMEIVDNLTVLAVPGAMDSHLDSPLFWVSMLGGFVVAFPFAFLVNRALLRRGKGHALVHEYHAH
ncbi:MAG: DUF4396 domain-containing protein [Solirubrobacteraceae bacterium]|nr:DUF4396 domain-containing protein [Solirubrobacteraceae bacterium]